MKVKGHATAVSSVRMGVVDGQGHARAIVIVAQMVCHTADVDLVRASSLEAIVLFELVE